MILTRPEAAARRFLAEVTAAFGQEPAHLIAPMMRISPLSARLSDNVAGLVFTSENSVPEALRLGAMTTLPAYCVGPRTREAAEAAGFRAVALGGDADRLVQGLIALRPKTPLAHLHGVESRGNVAEALTSAGIPCVSVPCYEQIALAPLPTLRAALSGQRPVLLPLFSPRSATILTAALGARPSAPVTVVAMSPAVADQAAELATAGLWVADQPDAAAMVAAVCDALAAAGRGGIA